MCGQFPFFHFAFLVPVAASEKHIFSTSQFSRSLTPHNSSSLHSTTMLSLTPKQYLHFFCKQVFALQDRVSTTFAFIYPNLVKNDLPAAISKQFRFTRPCHSTTVKSVVEISFSLCKSSLLHEILKFRYYL